MRNDYDPDERGIWAIYGEDPNCDYGGHHHTPLLGHAEGKYEDCLAYARTLDKWMNWGNGGRLTKVVVKTITSNSVKEREDLKTKQGRLERELQTVKEELE